MTKQETNYNPEADRRWNQKNKEHRRYLTDRTSARRFIRNKATLEDLTELKQLIEEREKSLNE